MGHRSGSAFGSAERTLHPARCRLLTRTNCFVMRRDVCCNIVYRLEMSRCVASCASSEKLEAAGIAPASLISDIVLKDDARVEHGCQSLQSVCTDAGVAVLVASCRRLTPDVRAAIVQLVRGRG